MVLTRAQAAAAQRDALSSHVSLRESQTKTKKSSPGRPRKTRQPQANRSFKNAASIKKSRAAQHSGNPTKSSSKASPQQRLDIGVLPRPNLQGKKLRSIKHWTKRQEWPQDFFEPEMPEYVPAEDEFLPDRRRPKALHASTSSMMRSEADTQASKSFPYQDFRYDILLQTQGSYMDEPSQQEVALASKSLCNSLLEQPQLLPAETLFRDDVFKRTMERISGRKEARIIQDISRLIVPSAESLATLGAAHLDILIESVNEAWTNTKPLVGPPPQPDYAVGFSEKAFSSKQYAKLLPFLGDVLAPDKSKFMATMFMYFPFLSCEAKCGAQGLDVADRQNMHSMTIAVRAVVNLFQLVKRQDEVDQQILGFSVSHTDRDVRIYGHYAVCLGETTKYYRRLINSFNLLLFEGREKWTAYRFTKNVYDNWMPVHFKRICSAIDQLPDPNTIPSALTEEGNGATELGEDDSDIQSSDVVPTPAVQQPRKKRKGI